MMLRDSAANFDNRRFLKRVAANDFGRYLPGDGDQWNAIQLGIGDRGHEVRGAGSAGGHADADLAGAASHALGGKRPALFVARQDRPELVAKAGQRLMEWHAATAGVGENRIDTVVDQRLDEDIGSGC